MTATLTNGRSRKSLAEQIERLDSILDGLSDGLNEAVATAVKEAVRAVLTEVLTNPELLARLHPVQAVPESSHPSGWLARTWDGARSALRYLAEQMGVCRASVGQACGSGWEKLTAGSRGLRARSVRLLIAGGNMLLRTRWLLASVLAAATLAGLTGVAAYHLGPWMAAGVSGAGGLGTALARPSNESWLCWAWPWRASAD
jgi:hypothetical protein